ncbi:MAG TPA: type I-D CRISPR-associated protein Cas5/Csc1 [Caldilineaceae bacterium]|nr:type I-D CRISPR-associated protein Cas5/Csc1 [Caldilineaceae bacterium]
MVITLCSLILHENVFFATREIGRLYETGRYLHNYALSYALGLALSPYHNATAVPRYQEELSALNTAALYVMPARPVAVEFEIATFKYADNRYRLQMEQGSRNTPSFGRAKELAVGSRFEFAILSPQRLRLPQWVRLGKWMSKAQLLINSVETVERIGEGIFTAAFPVNPLDLPTEVRLLGYDLISLPPVSLLDNVTLEGPYQRLADGRAIPAHLAYRFPA